MPYDERDDQTKQFEATYARQEFLDAVAELEPTGTREVADRVGCHVNLARERLKELASDGELEQKDIGRRLVFTTSFPNTA